MTARQSSAVERAIELVRSGMSQTDAAKATGCDRTSVWRACRALQIPARRGPPKKVRE